MAHYDNPTSDSDQQHSNTTHGNVNPIRSSQRLSFEQSSLTSENGGGGRRLSVSVFQPALGPDGQVTGAYWESRDLSRRPNIHRSHLSSSIQTGNLGIFYPIDGDRRNTPVKSTDGICSSTNFPISGISSSANFFRDIKCEKTSIHSDSPRRFYSLHPRRNFIESRKSASPGFVTSSCLG